MPLAMCPAGGEAAKCPLAMCPAGGSTARGGHVAASMLVLMGTLVVCTWRSLQRRHAAGSPSSCPRPSTPPTSVTTASGCTACTLNCSHSRSPAAGPTAVRDSIAPVGCAAMTLLPSRAAIAHASASGSVREVAAAQLYAPPDSRALPGSASALLRTGNTTEQSSPRLFPLLPPPPPPPAPTPPRLMSRPASLNTTTCDVSRRGPTSGDSPSSTAQGGVAPRDEEAVGTGAVVAAVAIITGELMPCAPSPPLASTCWGDCPGHTCRWRRRGLATGTGTVRRVLSSTVAVLLAAAATADADAAAAAAAGESSTLRKRASRSLPAWQPSSSTAVSSCDGRGRCVRGG